MAAWHIAVNVWIFAGRAKKLVNTVAKIFTACVRIAAHAATVLISVKTAASVASAITSAKIAASTAQAV